MKGKTIDPSVPRALQGLELAGEIHAVQARHIEVHMEEFGENPELSARAHSHRESADDVERARADVLSWIARERARLGFSKQRAPSVAVGVGREALHLAAPRERRETQRSSARSGDSGSDSESSEPSQRRLCQNTRCSADISHLHALAEYCPGGACKQAAYRDRLTVEHLDELVGTVAVGLSCTCSPKRNLVIGGMCFHCGHPRGVVTRDWLGDDMRARSFVVTPAGSDNWRVRPDRKLSTKLRHTRGRWDKPAREEVAA